MQPFGLTLTRALGAAALGLAVAGGAAQAQQAPAAASNTFDAVKSRGQLVCGVNTGLAGFAQPDSQGVWRGFDVDYCKAVAAAIYGDANKVRYVPTTAQVRFTALQSGEVDVLSRNTTWTLSRDTSLGLDFVATSFYDGQGFMVKSSLGLKSAKELEGATICVQPGTTTEQNLTDWSRANRVRFTPVVIESFQEVTRAFFSGRCDAYTTDRSGLASIRAGQGARAAEYVILPETIGAEPLGPLVRKGDWRWFDIVRWTLNALVAAEEQGITQANADQRRGDSNPETQRLLGTSGEFGRQLGLEPDWALRAIRATGNFGEIWQRNQAPLGVQRGANRLARDGGLIWSPPFR